MLFCMVAAFLLLLLHVRAKDVNLARPTTVEAQHSGKQFFRLLAKREGDGADICTLDSSALR
ncbi:MAG TPA: hypothetical protein VLC12_06230, partial [Terriglobales bacterium]|nr:hypothetical protein [Terriglobales bacterium]